MSDDYLEHISELFKQKDYAEIIRVWGAETSNGDEFKGAAFSGYRPGQNDLVVSTYPKCGISWMTEQLPIKRSRRFRA